MNAYKERIRERRLSNMEYIKKQLLKRKAIKKKRSCSKKINKTCSFCFKEEEMTKQMKYCSDCRKDYNSRKGIEKQMKLAKCGHPSDKRYFKCEECLPVLPSDQGVEYDGLAFGNFEYEEEHCRRGKSVDSIAKSIEDGEFYTIEDL